MPKWASWQHVQFMSSFQPSSGVAVIFGGSRGIGAACTRLFALEGWKTVAVGRKPENLQWISYEKVRNGSYHITYFINIQFFYP